MNAFEEPIMPPEGGGGGGRYESADIDIEELEKFLTDTKFENEEEITELLTRRYYMSRREHVEHIEVNMTREMDLIGAIDVVDPGHLLPRDQETIGENFGKIAKAISDGKGSVVIDKYGFILTDRVKEAFDRVYKGKPLSGYDPRAVMRKTINTIDGKHLDLRIFQVFNRNQKFRYEYVLVPVEELEQAI